jgi:hypothetical protein
MTSEINLLLEKLQQAIDAAISDSTRINGIVDEMKSYGYDLCLIVESSAAISPIEETPDVVPDPRLKSKMLASNGEIQLTDQDREFLQGLNISLAA